MNYTSLSGVAILAIGNFRSFLDCLGFELIYGLEQMTRVLGFDHASKGQFEAYAQLYGLASVCRLTSLPGITGKHSSWIYSFKGGHSLIVSTATIKSASKDILGLTFLLPSIAILGDTFTACATELLECVNEMKIGCKVIGYTCNYPAISGNPYVKGRDRLHPKGTQRAPVYSKQVLQGIAEMSSEEFETDMFDSAKLDCIISPDMRWYVFMRRYYRKAHIYLFDTADTIRLPSHAEQCRRTLLVLTDPVLNPDIISQFVRDARVVLDDNDTITNIVLRPHPSSPKDVKLRLREAFEHQYSSSAEIRLSTEDLLLEDIKNSCCILTVITSALVRISVAHSGTCYISLGAFFALQSALGYSEDAFSDKWLPMVEPGSKSFFKVIGVDGSLQSLVHDVTKDIRDLIPRVCSIVELTKILERTSPSGVKRQGLNISKILDFGWKPLVSFRTGIKKTIRAYWA